MKRGKYFKLRTPNNKINSKVAGLACTASKQPHRYPEHYPNEIVSGSGAYIYDHDGLEYLDFVCSLGAITLGHRFKEVDEKVIWSIKSEGQIFSLPHKKEEILANILSDILPSAERSRFAHNGADVTTAAVRLARFITGKEKVLSFSYHGAQDVFMACTKADAGVPKCLKETIVDIDYNDFRAVEMAFMKKDIAAVIVEPHTIREPKYGYLEFLREICTKNGALLIFDEVVSFPRYPGFSAQTYFCVYPDLTCISKGMANGYAISALCGKEKYMKELRDGGVFFSTTQGGNLVGVTAAIETLRFIVQNNVPYHLKKVGEKLNIKNNKHVKLVGYPWRQFFECDDLVRQKIWQEMIKEGVFFGVPIFFNYSMTEEMMKDVSCKLNSIIDRMDSIRIKGRTIKEVFKKR
jgi:glutamate-1-semialdehyde aminotransferase